MRYIRSFFSISLFIIIVILILTLWKISWKTKLMPIVENDIISECISPDEKYKAVFLTSDAGATTQKGYKVAVLKKAEKVHNENIIYIGDCVENVDLDWQDDSNLIVKIWDDSVGSRTFKAKDKVEELNINYYINTVSYQREKKEYFIDEKSSIVWNEGKFQIVQTDDRKDLLVFDDSGSTTTLLENIIYSRWCRSELYIISEKGYGIIDRNDLCRISLGETYSDNIKMAHGVEYLEKYDLFEDGERFEFESMKTEVCR